jgi:hypothetical protein
VGGQYLAFILIGLYLGNSSSSTWARIHCWWCREGTSWCRQGQHGERRSDSLTNSSPTRAWISGRYPMLVVSIVTAQKNPLY